MFIWEQVSPQQLASLSASQSLHSDFFPAAILCALPFPAIVVTGQVKLVGFTGWTSLQPASGDPFVV